MINSCCSQSYINSYNSLDQKFDDLTPELKHKKLKNFKCNCFFGTGISVLFLNMITCSALATIPQLNHSSIFFITEKICTFTWIGGVTCCIICNEFNMDCMPDAYSKAGLISCLACHVFMPSFPICFDQDLHENMLLEHLMNGTDN